MRWDVSRYCGAEGGGAARISCWTRQVEPLKWYCAKRVRSWGLGAAENVGVHAVHCTQ